MMYTTSMKRQLDPLKIKNWAKSVGGTSKAVKALMMATEIAPVTAEKIATGRYTSEPKFLLRKAIADLTGIPESELFPVVD